MPTLGRTQLVLVQRKLMRGLCIVFRSTTPWSEQSRKKRRTVRASQCSRTSARSPVANECVEHTTQSLNCDKCGWSNMQYFAAAAWQQLQRNPCVSHTSACFGLLHSILRRTLPATRPNLTRVNRMILSNVACFFSMIRNIVSNQRHIYSILLLAWEDIQTVVCAFPRTSATCMSVAS